MEYKNRNSAEKLLIGSEFVVEKMSAGFVHKIFLSFFKFGQAQEKNKPYL